KRMLFVEFGGGQAQAFSLAGKQKYAMEVWDSRLKGCEPLLQSAYPGLAYDDTLDRVVGWVGGDSVYLFDPEARSCSTLTYPGGPGALTGNGPNGRFRYFPSLRVFALINDWKQNAYVLRLTQTTP